MDVLTLRDELASLLTASLGTYTLSNGATTPAVSVRAVGRPMTPGTTVSGLELIVQRDPKPISIVQYRLPTAFAEWTLYLVQWGDASGEITAAAQLISETYSGVVIEPLTIPPAIGPTHQLRVTIQTNPPTTIPDETPPEEP